MTPEERVAEIMHRYASHSLPSTSDVLRALLTYTYQQGKCDGAEEAAAALRKTFERPALTV